MSYIIKSFIFFLFVSLCITSCRDKDSTTTNISAKQPAQKLREPKTYYFVVIRGTINNDRLDPTQNPRKKFGWCTRVQELEYLNEDVKYKLLDEAESDYLQTPKAVAYNASITQRLFYSYNSYAAASKAREVVMTSGN